MFFKIVKFIQLSTHSKQHTDRGEKKIWAGFSFFATALVLKFLVRQRKLGKLEVGGGSFKTQTPFLSRRERGEKGVRE
jgi:hypothetical protein